MTKDQALKEMYKAHLGNSVFNIDKLEKLIVKLVDEKNQYAEYIKDLSVDLSDFKHFLKGMG